MIVSLTRFGSIFIRSKNILLLESPSFAIKEKGNCKKYFKETANVKIIGDAL